MSKAIDVPWLGLVGCPPIAQRNIKHPLLRLGQPRQNFCHIIHFKVIELQRKLDVFACVLVFERFILWRVNMDACSGFLQSFQGFANFG
ncbi:hypothetical protein D9M68_750020 [compost metagenome]